MDGAQLEAQLGQYELDDAQKEMIRRMAQEKRAALPQAKPEAATAAKPEAAPEMSKEDRLASFLGRGEAERMGQLGAPEVGLQNKTVEELYNDKVMAGDMLGSAANLGYNIAGSIPSQAAGAGAGLLLSAAGFAGWPVVAAAGLVGGAASLLSQEKTENAIRDLFGSDKRT